MIFLGQKSCLCSTTKATTCPLLVFQINGLLIIADWKQQSPGFHLWILLCSARPPALGTGQAAPRSRAQLWAPHSQTDPEGPQRVQSRAGGWGGGWGTGLVGSGWGSWGGSACRKGGSGGPDRSQLPGRGCGQGGSVSAPREPATGQEGTASSCARGGLGWVPGKVLLHQKGGQALAQAAQGAGGVTSPGGV